jgi:hypothetical protein
MDRNASRTHWNRTRNPRRTQRSYLYACWKNRGSFSSVIDENTGTYDRCILIEKYFTIYVMYIYITTYMPNSHVVALSTFGPPKINTSQEVKHSHSEVWQKENRTHVASVTLRWLHSTRIDFVCLPATFFISPISVFVLLRLTRRRSSTNFSSSSQELE